MGRDLKHVLIVDNSPASYSFHPENAVSLFSIKPYLIRFLSYADTIPGIFSDVLLTVTRLLKTE